MKPIGFGDSVEYAGSGFRLKNLNFLVSSLVFGFLC